MMPLSLTDSELYGPIQGHLVVSKPNFNPAMAASLGEVAILLVYQENGDTASLYLTKDQTIELRDYLNQLLEENI